MLDSYDEPALYAIVVSSAWLELFWRTRAKSSNELDFQEYIRLRIPETQDAPGVGTDANGVTTTTSSETSDRVRSLT